ncbi:MAG: MlaD family protein [Treponema sp.]|jgi:phospholipid/cholesterol/gamma-HCH transport system substrate-binding protein|nr:MlaD family protein [Treponema sp.]
MNISRYVKVALFFVILGSAGGTYIILSSDGIGNFNTKTYDVILPDATGLTTRSKVYLAGVPVGKISAIHLAGSEAQIKIAFLKDVEIRGDAQISRKSSSILGTSMLVLDPGTELTPLIPEGSLINTKREAGDLNAVMGIVQELGGQVSLLLQEFQTNQMELLAVSLQTFNSIAQKIDAQSDAELARISRILESVALITERTERLLASREGDLNTSVGDFREILENIRYITGEIRAGQGNIGQIIYDDRLYLSLLSAMERTEVAVEKLQVALDSVNTLAVNVNGVVDTAGEIVSRAAGLGIQVDTQARYDLLSERVRAGAALRLDPLSNDRWYRIGVSSAPDGVASRRITEITDENGVLKSYENTTETRYSFLVDVELARRFGPLTIRGGLLENSAGLGLDFQPVKWVSLSGEVFDFKTGELPNLRGTLTFYPFFDPDADKPWNWLYFRGGVSRALSNEGRDFFIGGGIRFADREVKGLVGLVPAAMSW